MDTEFTEEQDQLRGEIRRFLEEQAPLASTREHWDDPNGTSEKIWKGLVDMGLVGLLAPEDLGGSGGGMRDMGVVMQELGRVAYSGPFMASAVGGMSMAVALGAEQLIPRLADGSVIATLAHAEPNRSMPRWAEPKTLVKGDRLNGTKCWVAHGDSADLFFVTAADGVYLVDRNSEGVSIEGAASIDGTRRFAHLNLDDAPGEKLGDLAVVSGVLDRLLVAGTADAIGAAEVCLEQTVAYAKERKQFDQPIGSFQAVAHLCTDMLEAIELTRAGLHYALSASDLADPEERHRAAVMTKAQASEILTPVGGHAIQIFGGVGFTWEYDLHLYHRRLLGLDQEWGGGEEWLEELARIIL
jgi:alkylation response protein AidB-like acyl-CoA dehydrogenase